MTPTQFQSFEQALQDASAEASEFAGEWCAPRAVAIAISIAEAAVRFYDAIGNTTLAEFYTEHIADLRTFED